MKDIDKRELQELKRKRQEKLLSENPPERLLRAIKDPDGEDISEEINDIRWESNIRKEQISTGRTIERESAIEEPEYKEPTYTRRQPERRVYARVELEDVLEKERIYIEPTTIRPPKDAGDISLGGFKVKGLIQAAIAVFGLIVGMVTTWVNLDNTLRSNTIRIEHMEAELATARKNNSDVYSFLTVDYEKRIAKVENDLKSLQKTIVNSNQQTTISMRQLYSDMEKLKNIEAHNSREITQLMRDVDKLENQIRKMTK